MSHMAVEPDGIGKVAQQLTKIVALYADLPEQAVNDATSHLMPGGRAMIALGPIANLEAWENLTDASERYGRTFTFPELEDDDDEWFAAQVIGYWAQAWRREHNAEYDDQKITLATEVNFVRNCLDWAWTNATDAEWKAFTKSIDGALSGLENILRAGERSERGVPCMYEECGGKLLRRKLVPTRDEDGKKMWIHSKWHCPKCHREYDDEAYKLNVRAAAEQAKTEWIDGDLWCSVDWAAQTVGRPDSTVRVWVHRGEVATTSELSGGRTGFVRLDDVIERDAKAKRRTKGGRVA